MDDNLKELTHNKKFSIINDFGKRLQITIDFLFSDLLS
jgi:hypothetical protein